MPSSCRPAPWTAAAARSTISRRTATTTTRERRPAGVWTMPSGWKSSDGLVHRHRDVVRRGGADGGGERLRVLDDGGEVERAHDDALVGDAEAHALGQLVLGEERLERLRERDRVGDLAVAHDAGPELGDCAAGQGEGAVDAHLGGGEVAGVELEADHAGLGGTLLTEHGSCIGSSRAVRLERPLNARSGPEGPLRGAVQCSGR